MDAVSELLASLDARCVITGGLRAGGEWAYEFRPDAPIKLDAVLHGSCWLIAGGEPPRRLAAGDAVVLTGVASAVLASRPDARPGPAPTGDGFFRHVGNPDDGTEIIGGHVELDAGALPIFLAGLPAVLHAPATSREAREIARGLGELAGEADSARPGASFAMNQHAQLLLLHVLRAARHDDDRLDPGWLRLANDEQLRPALALMYTEPGRHWQLRELAAAANLSRSQFAERFRRVAGEPPLAHLTRWRMLSARRHLRTSDVTVARLAGMLGYASESSFSHTFRRVVGTSPSDYRRHAI